MTALARRVSGDAVVGGGVALAFVGVIVAVLPSAGAGHESGDLAAAILLVVSLPVW